MKNIKYLILLIALTMFVGCEAKIRVESKDSKPKPLPLTVYQIEDEVVNGYLQKVTFENHDYLLFSNQGKSMIHSESCPCKNK